MDIKLKRDFMKKYERFTGQSAYWRLKIYAGKNILFKLLEVDIVFLYFCNTQWWACYYWPFVSYIWKIYLKYIYIYIYYTLIYIPTHIYIIYIYICIFVYFYIGQSFKEVNLAGIKNCLTLVVKVESLQSITSRQTICH